MTKKNSEKRAKQKKILKYILLSGFIFSIIILVAVGIFIKKTAENLPDYNKLKDYTPIITTRLYAADGALISEYSKEKRVFVPIELIPEHLKNAFIAAEDSNFYQNSGIDIFAIFRTAIKNVISYVSGGERMGGASTITQQVVKNFLLTRERTIERKIKEAILAYQMTKTFSKDKILELYLNQIYLGSGAYGVAAAAEVYFDKSIDELKIEEVALLATLPKAPSKLDPRKNIEKAKFRRDWVISRMVEEEFITQEEGDIARNEPIILKLKKDDKDFTRANFFADSVKKELTSLYGSDDVFEEGIFVRTTLDSKLQKIANEAFTKGIESYDKRHGYRGALGKIKTKNREIKEIVAELNKFKIEKFYKPEWAKAVILEVADDFAQIITQDSEKGKINLENLSWARRYISTNKQGPKIRKVSDVLRQGDVILVEEIVEENDEKIAKNNNKKENLDSEKTEEIVEKNFILKQIPDVNGAFLVMDPHTGRVLAMMGGYVDLPNQFNRAIQAYRQPGSTMKTFGYLSALENNMTPATVIIDEPITINQGDDLPPYNPTNYSGIFYGPTTLRTGLEKSRNVTTVRMADQIGLDKIVEVVKRFGINDNPKNIHSLVLGSTETSLEKLVNAYSIMVNGGKRVKSAMIEKIQDRDGKTIYRRDQAKCDKCLVDEENANNLPIIPDLRERVVDEATAYQISYMLQGVVERGTAWRARKINKITAGKTGTTNNSYDSWYVGFTPDLIAGVYIGFDIPKNLGAHETGSSVALPIFVDFMKEALKDTPSKPFRVPDSIKFVKIDRTIGKFATPQTPKQNIFFEAFKLTDDVDKILSNDNNESLEKDSDIILELEPSGIY